MEVRSVKAPEGEILTGFAHPSEDPQELAYCSLTDRNCVKIEVSEIAGPSCFLEVLNATYLVGEVEIRTSTPAYLCSHITYEAAK